MRKLDADTENEINKKRWERWRAKQKTEREKTCFYCWDNWNNWSDILVDGECFVECIFGDCAVPLIEYFTKVPQPDPPGGPCGLCVTICSVCFTGCFFAVTGIGALVAIATCAGCGVCCGAEVDYCLDQCEIF
ncbi:MAG: hypothetical protein KAT65_26165 [Methanophagales archaeon]|nr:hypothetical protein [Methanophagales archaeon]